MVMSERDVAAVVERVIRERRDQAGPLLPILHGIQDELGHVPRNAVPTIAEALNLSRAEVHGVVRSGRRLSRSASALLDLIEKQGRSNL